MKNKTVLHSTESDALQPKKQRSYNEIVEFLDANWQTNRADAGLNALSQLDQALGSPSKKVPAILVGGTNGKSLTIGFTAKLLREENLTIGSFTSPHILTYNERFSLNSATISNKALTEVGNEVIGTAESLSLTLNSFELLTMMALVYFKHMKADVAILEASENNLPRATSICAPYVVGITRLAEGASPATNKAEEAVVQRFLGIVKPNTHVVSADQSKLNLQTMQDIVEAKGATWSMPIRKLALLPYPFEQLHGRCAALAERIASIFINAFVNQQSTVVAESLLTKIKGQRGRPTLEAKRRSEMHPKKTVDQFWKDTINDLPGRFQLLTKEKPTILLDNASNLDAIRNLLLGIRLLHYQRSLKGLTLILGNNNDMLDTPELLKLLRYFFKKTSGQIIVCPSEPSASNMSSGSWDAEQIANDLKSMKIKARSAHNFKEAFEAATATVDERYGLVVITGSQELITEYWRTKGIKKV
jgi:dihydrofolate synthase / folylpolyglutamate synthase